jgi:peptidoglycan hydrolase-like protein with peptidoglycan-binding domain
MKMEITNKLTNIKEQSFPGGAFPGGGGAFPGGGGAFPGGGGAFPGGGGAFPGGTTNTFDCLKTEPTNKLSSDGKTMVRETTGSTWTYYSDYKFTYKFKSDGEIINGTWECNGANNFKIKTDDGESYDSTTGKWTKPSGGSSDSGSRPTLTDTSLTIDDVKAGKEVSKGMRGPVVGEIQKLLIAAGYKNISKSGNPDNIFGSRTKSSVEGFQKANKDAEGNQLTADGIVGDKTINALLKATPASSSSSSEDPNRKPFDPNAEEDNSIPSTDGALIKAEEKLLQESLKKMLRNSLLKYS